ncbi:hypothetical protein OX284_014295 [Flavobacterium sp. SUN046]|uniref:hypothetical protein n=1 Tax=Flavobacterium sp. SUN046 TaxID=3002440 RepID=UPI002DB6120B|nr:hypothetical protein [Flavobacterium sp. SUN046]MEC4050606.1 hypothetical protein [Flavobacterium sp. SUN046]
MESNTHHNPTLSMLFGALLSISAYLHDNGFIVDNLLQLLKVILFGIIGGAMGYVGKILASKIHKKIK